MGKCNSQLRARRGVSFQRVWRWCTEPLIYVQVTAVSSLTPLTLTATAHGVTDGASVAFAELGGLVSLNAKCWPPGESDYYRATVVDVNTLRFDSIDAARSGETYSSGGKVVHATPVDLSSISGVNFHLYEIADPTTAILTKACSLDNTAKTISLNLTPADVSGLTSDEYTFNLLATANDNVTVTLLDEGAFGVDPVGAT